MGQATLKTANTTTLTYETQDWTATENIQEEWDGI